MRGTTFASTDSGDGADQSVLGRHTHPFFSPPHYFLKAIMYYNSGTPTTESKSPGGQGGHKGTQQREHVTLGQGSHIHPLPTGTV